MMKALARSSSAIFLAWTFHAVSIPWMKQACPARILTASTVTFSSMRIDPFVDSISEYFPEFWITRLPGVLMES